MLHKLIGLYSITYDALESLGIKAIKVAFIKGSKTPLLRNPAPPS
jgi:hypothetical protein